MNDAICCPGCEAQLLLPALPTGQTVACPRCQRVFEPAAQQRPNPALPPVRRVNTPTPVEPADDPAFVPRPRRTEAPRGVWRGYLAMTLLAISSFAFALYGYCEIELIVLIHAQQDMGMPRQIPGAGPFGGEMIFIEGPKFQRPAPPPDPQQARLNERWDRWENLRSVPRGLVHLFFWPALLALFIWLYRAHRNLPGLNAQGLSFTPAWAVIGFFVPIFNLGVPFAFMQEIWRASHPHAIDTPQTWRKSPYARSLRIWWFFYAVAMCLWLGVLLTGPNFPQTYDELKGSAWLAAAASICSAAACVLTIYIIRTISQRQQLRYANL